jgi:hypothetical protein
MNTKRFTASNDSDMNVAMRCATMIMAMKDARPQISRVAQPHLTKCESWADFGRKCEA